MVGRAAGRLGGGVNRPLDGVRVVAIEQAVAAPFASRQLADLGARVIKIERPGDGDFARKYDTSVHGQSSHFVWLNRGKQSLTLDLKDTDDREVLDALLAEADVLLSNLAPGAMSRMGLGADEVTARLPRLIVCTVSGYGDTGPYREKKAYDLLVQCETGLVSTTGTPHQPAKSGIAVADIAAGMYAYSGILAALLHRERTGEGTAFEVSMLEALGEWMGYPYLYAEYGGTQPPRCGARHSSISPYGPYRVGGERQVFLGVQNHREWVRFCSDVLRDPELATDERFHDNPARKANDDELTAVIEQVFARETLDVITRRLDEAGIANAELRDMKSFSAHPQLAARERWTEVRTPGGDVRMLRPPVEFGTPTYGAVPAVGEHTTAIRAELGFEA